MPLIVRGESFLLPTEGNSQAPTGREVIAIEEAFGLDGLTLLATLGEEKPNPNPAYSKIKALYSLAWICMTRAGKVLSIDDALNTYSINEITTEVDEKKLPTAEN